MLLSTLFNFYVLKLKSLNSNMHAPEIYFPYNNIIFQSESMDTSIAYIQFQTTNTSLDNYIVKLNGADYITFKGISFWGKGHYGSRVFLFENGADNNIIDSCIVKGGYNNPFIQFQDHDILIESSPSNVLNNNNLLKYTVI